MPPVTSTTLNLRTPYADGSNGQHEDVTFAEFGPDHTPVNNPITVFANARADLVSVTVNPDGNNPKVVRFKTIAPKPGNIATVNIILDAGIVKDGSPVRDTVTVALTASPDGSSFEIVNVGPVIDD